MPWGYYLMKDDPDMDEKFHKMVQLIKLKDEGWTAGNKGSHDIHLNLAPSLW